MRTPPLLLLALISLTTAGLRAAPTPLPMPEGTKAKASFATEGERGRVENLIDGDPATSVSGAASSCKGPNEPVWIDVTFPHPIANLSGVETGTSDVFKNYFPKQAQFWVDTDGNGTFDTLGGSAKLGPAEESVGRHLFGGRIPQAHALRFLVTEQNQTGLNRSFVMSELRLVVDSAAQPMALTTTRKVEDAIQEQQAAKELANRLAAEERRRNAPKPDQSIVSGSAKLAGTILPLPTNTVIRSSFGTEKDGGPAVLFDGDPGTVLRGAGGSCSSPFSVASIYLRFSKPIANIGGIETGNSDPLHNYYPVEMEFWGDSDGDGRFDTLLGRTRKLGPAAQCIGRHPFDFRLPLAYGLEIRAVQQHVGGGKRAYQMDEMRLIQNDLLPVATPTPDSYRVLFYSRPIPSGTTARVTVATEADKGAEVLLDNNPQTFMNPKQGTAKEGVPVSVFLRFPAPVSNVAGITLGSSDPFRNYVWQEMEVYADTVGDGKYGTLAATLAEGAGERRFQSAVPTVYGFELRVTKQTLQGSKRAFMLSGVEGLVFKDEAGKSEMRFVVEDFEDFSSWRTWAGNTAQPEGERPYGGYTYLCGGYRPGIAKNGNGVGIMRYCFKDGKGNSMRATRGRVSETEALIDKIQFQANPQGYPCSIGFQMVDARGKQFYLPSVALSNSTAWATYAIDLNTKTVPNLSDFIYPFKMVAITLNSNKGGTGDVLLDDITYVGVVDLSKRLTIKPVWEGMAYDPTKPVIVKYTLRSALDHKTSAMMKATLFSSLDAKRTMPLASKTIPFNVDAYGTTIVPVDFGALPYGHYAVIVTVATQEITAECVDPVAVLTLNGGRINKSPMWFGSQHSDGWIADEENNFVYREVVKPLGIDCYRGSTPKKALMDLGLLCTAGLSKNLPKQLIKPEDKGDDRGEPTDYAAYEAWVKEEAARTLAPYADKIICTEYYNEPDLPGFCYKPEIDVYLKMWRAWASGIRAGAPGIKIGTSGNTVRHGKEKKDFNSRMYTELAKEADVAVFHAHGPVDNYIGLQHIVEDWLTAGGRPKDRWVIGNSEAGIPSGSSPMGLLSQADCLVEKIGWAKSQKASLFYHWFTTTDTYDPQGGYLNGENWGLITYNQRLKPSGQAYNELIRKLANTEGLGTVDLDSRLVACAYRRNDGMGVWLVWPRESGARLILRFSADGDVTVTDMFGGSRKVSPAGGQVAFSGDGHPFYVEAAKGVKFGRAEASAFATYQEVIGIRPGAQTMLPIDIKNIWDRDAELTVSLQDEKGAVLAKTQVSLARGTRGKAMLAYTLPASTKYGTLGYALRFSSMPKGLADQTLPLTLVVAEKAVRATSFKIDGVADVIPNATPIVCNKDSQVHEMAFDPSTPMWAGPDDLSSKTTLAHDGKGLYLCVEVKDQSHNPGPASNLLWTKDSIQVALYAGDAHTEIGLTETGAGYGWCWISPLPARINKQLDSPLAVKREGNITTYETYLSFEALGIHYTPGTPLRFTFVVNEDDGRGRVRAMKWFDGILAGKSSDLFGHLVLE
jgi:hypothetical protein